MLKYIIFFCFVFSDYNNDAIVRAQATILLHKIITKKPEYANTFLHFVLAELEKNKNKRYFKDSHLHRIKHRLVQTLLVLEPVLNMVIKNRKFYKTISEITVCCTPN